MKLHRMDSDNVNFVTRFGPDSLSINGQSYKHSIILSAQTIEKWKPDTFEDFIADDFQHLAKFDAEIVIIGTGQKIRFPNSQLLEPLRQQKCGFEVMDSKAACRTYNVLVGDDRKVVAGILLDAV